MRKTLKIIGITIIMVMLALTVGCASNNGTSASNKAASTPNTATGTLNKEADKVNNETNLEQKKVQFEMENGGKFTIELYPEYAPKTVQNFLDLAGSGFYDGLTFHRVIKDFMAQGGDPEGTGMGGSEKKIKGEFSSNGFAQNTLSHTRGTVSMARSSDPDSASSQFFICYSDNDIFLDGQYAAFGKVIEGMDVVDNFLKTKTDASDKPVTPIVIKKATVLD